jgi:hypothetical protein
VLLWDKEGLGMSLRNFSISILLLAAAGCTTLDPMPEGHYNQYASRIALLQKCFEAEHVSPQFYAESRGALAYGLTTWIYDQDKFSRITGYKYSISTASRSKCRSLQGEMYQMIAMVEERKAEVQASNQANNQAWNQAFQQVNTYRPVYCYNVSGVVMCN